MSSQPKETSEWEQQINGGSHWLSIACGAFQAHVGAVRREAQGQGRLEAPGRGCLGLSVKEGPRALSLGGISEGPSKSSEL